jgi:hypothetical protein
VDLNSTESVAELKTMLNYRYIVSFMPVIAEAMVRGAESAAKVNPAACILDWESWRKKYGILNDRELPEDESQYIKVEGAADRVNSGYGGSWGFLFLPKGFAEKALVLGFMPD